MATPSSFLVANFLGGPDQYCLHCSLGTTHCEPQAGGLQKIAERKAVQALMLRLPFFFFCLR